MMLAFVLGACVFGFGILFGASVVKSSYNDILKNNTND